MYNYDDIEYVNKDGKTVFDTKEDGSIEVVDEEKKKEIEDKLNGQKDK